MLRVCVFALTGRGSEKVDTSASALGSLYKISVYNGLASLVGFQTFTNIAVATGVFPNTGLPLPFVSYGVSSLVSLYIGIGVVLNVGIQQSKMEN